MRVVRIATFVEEVEQPDWLIDGLLPSVGWTLFVGMQGLGKTTFATQMVAALQGGMTFLGLQTQRTRILYIQADSPTIEWREMLRRIAPQSSGLTLVDVPAGCMDNPQYISYIAKVAEEVNPGFVVFDSFYNMTGQPIGTERGLVPINMMKGVAQGKPWMLIHHPPHGESRGAGHHSIEANASNVWVLFKDKLAVRKGRMVKNVEIKLTRTDEGLWQLRDDIKRRTNSDSLLDREL